MKFVVKTDENIFVFFFYFLISDCGLSAKFTSFLWASSFFDLNLFSSGNHIIIVG